MPVSGEQVLPFAELVRADKADRLWTGQSLLIEPHSALAYATGAGARIPLGTSVALMALRHPFQAALQARSLAALTGHPVVAGFGPGPAPFVQSLSGRTYASPLGAVREYATIVRGLLCGDVVGLSGEYFSMSGALPPLAGPPVELGLGVLRPRMAELAGELADVAITWLTPPHYLAEVIIPALQKGAARADRPRPRVTAVVHVSLDAPGREHTDVVLAASHAHLQAPHYQDMLRRAGVAVDIADLCGSADRLVAGQAVAVGSTSTLSTIGVHAQSGSIAALTDLRSILDAHKAEDAVNEELPR